MDRHESSNQFPSIPSVQRKQRKPLNGMAAYITDNSGDCQRVDNFKLLLADLARSHLNPWHVSYHWVFDP